MTITIINEAVLSHWGAVKSTVWVNDERLGHIRSHHPQDHNYYSQFLEAAIVSPVLILEDHKNERTAMFIGRTDREGVNVIVKLARLEDGAERSFVVTMYPVGARSIEKLRRHNKVIWEKVLFDDGPLQDELPVV